MAITVEQEKKPINWVAALVTIIIVAVLFIGSYFLFFKKPELIEIVVPGTLQNVSSISRLTVDPEDVLNLPTFKLLRQYGTSVTIPTPGRSNPFKPF